MLIGTAKELWRQSEATTPMSPLPTRAAQYVRMSTERQDLSVEIQTTMNTAFAATHGFEIVQTFADEGVSGLRIQKRVGLQALLAEVVAGSADFSAILVYDVSRWGRFQNNDEAAHYEFLCAQAGVQVEYTAEPFANDGSLSSTVLKALKRVMAAEYSRELSAKTRAAHTAAANRGFWPGAPCGYGFRRQGVSRKTGQSLGRHGYGEPKEQGAHSRLVVGPDEEVATVRRIFRLFAYERCAMTEIARRLNSEGIACDGGRKWTCSVIKTILTSEKYAGRVVRGRTRSTLGKSIRIADRTQWQVIDGAAPKLVGRRLWEAAQAEMALRQRGPNREELAEELRRLERECGFVTEMTVRRHGRYKTKRYYSNFGSVSAAIEFAGCNRQTDQLPKTWRRGQHLSLTAKEHLARDEAMLATLRKVLVAHGYLSISLLKSLPGVPDPLTYRNHFGGLARAYAMVGYAPDGRQGGMIARGVKWATPDEPMQLVAEANTRFKDGFVVRTGRDAALDGLRNLLAKEGRLTCGLISAARDLPAVPTVVKYFGSMEAAYHAVGYEPNRRQTSRIDVWARRDMQPVS